MPSLAVWKSRRYRTSESFRAASARLRSVMSSMARRIRSGSSPSGGKRRALSSMILGPIAGKSCSTSKSWTAMAVAAGLPPAASAGGDVPLAVAEVVDEAALRLFFRDVEGPGRRRRSPS